MKNKPQTYGQITFKASHNSYERKESISDQLTFDCDEPWQGGCLGVEFDIWRHSSEYIYKKKMDGGYFTVSHVTPGKTPLKKWLHEIFFWHHKNPEHLPILITIDIKSSHGSYNNFHEEIDTYLYLFFDEKLIFSPKDLGYNKNLCSSIIENGWPSLNELKGKFIFCLSGNKDWKTEYTKYNLLTERYCFSDFDLSDSDKQLKPPTSGPFVFFNFNIFNKNSDTWTDTVFQFSQKNLITRAFTANSETNWQNGVLATFSAIATDKIRNHKWAAAGDSNQPFKEKRLIRDLRSLKNKENGEFRTDRATKMVKMHTSPECIFLFMKQIGENIYAIRNMKNHKYFDCTITTMSDLIKDDCQRWKLIPAARGNKNEFYIQNVQNKEYMTKKASQLSKDAGKDEVYILDKRQ